MRSGTTEAEVVVVVRREVVVAIGRAEDVVVVVEAATAYDPGRAANRAGRVGRWTICVMCVLDLNHEVCRITGLELDSYIEAFGMRAMRQLELRILQQCPERCVISTGAGSLDYGKTFRHLRHDALMVWLQADVATTVDRIRVRDGERNRLGTRPDLVTRESRRLSRRYRVSQLEIRTDNRQVDECLDELRRRLGEAGLDWQPRAADQEPERPIEVDIQQAQDSRPKRPYRLLGFMGPDGAGKTTLINGLMKELEARGLEFTYVHFSKTEMYLNPESIETLLPDEDRFVNIGPVGMALIVAGNTFYYVRAHLFEMFNLPVLFSLMMYYRLLAAFSRKIVLFDRIPQGLMYNKNDSRFFSAYHRMVCAVLPRPDVIYYLAADPGLIAARKDDLTLEEITRLVRFEPSVLVTFKMNHIRLDATMTPPELVREVMDSINA